MYKKNVPSKLISMNERIPENVIFVVNTLKSAGYEAYLVGGCVRDMMLHKDPKDWDVTTNAHPEKIIEVFEKTDRRVVYENNFGTVAIINKDLPFEDNSYSIEVTPYRTEVGYSDFRRPDSVEFALHINDDLSRRDFTVNALAFDTSTGTFVDNFNGLSDLKNKILRTVGEPDERFQEDALRIMRAIRFAAQLGYTIEENTFAALRKNAHLLKHVSQERIRDEFLKIIDAQFAFDAIVSMEKLGILEIIIPEFNEGIGCEQGGAHSFDVWTHLLKTFEHASVKNFPLHVKIAALFHDIGKPRTRRKSEVVGKKEWTFYGHEVVGAKMTKEIMQRLKFPKVLSEKVEKLVRYHMFFSDPENITLSAARRMVANVGKELIWDLMDLRACDRIGTGRPKDKPYRLRKYHAMLEEVLRDPVSVGMLKINGDIMLKEMGMKPSPRIGWILHAHLEEVLDDPSKNDFEYLQKRAVELNTLENEELKIIGEAGKSKKEEVDFQEVKALHKKHHVD